MANRGSLGFTIRRLRFGKAIGVLSESVSEHRRESVVYIISACSLMFEVVHKNSQLGYASPRDAFQHDRAQGWFLLQIHVYLRGEGVLEATCSVAPLDGIVVVLQLGLALRHREVPRTLAACATSQSPCALNRFTVRCTREGEYVVTGRRRQHLELELARHVAVEVSAQSERPAFRFS